VKRVLVTGATGFVGQPLCELLAHSGFVVRAALRNDRAVSACIAEKAVVGDIAATTDWRVALDGVDVVLHIAARVHVLNDAGASVQLYSKTNAQGTERLAKASAQAGIRRFVFLSSVKVNGEETTGHAYSPHDEPQPQDVYGTSKWLAEKHVMEVAGGTGMEAVIVRSPLVYGPGVRANFLRLLRWVDKEWPLPLGAIKNERSLVSIWNLCDLLALLLEHPLAPGRTWMVSDGEDVSTPELIQRLGRAMNRKVRLLPVPMSLLRLFGRLTRRDAEVARLCGSLLVNIDSTRRELEWVPPIKLDEGLARTVAAYLTARRQ
jgi:UDP-N-acetyl-alpha-D-quinovosamine dehydrogenase